MDTKKNEFFDLVTRKNGNGNYSLPLNVEHFYTDNKRYIDPLIKDKVHNVFNPRHREIVAAEDPIANNITWGYCMNAWDKYPKFYESEELGAPEILPEIREFLQSIKAHELFIVMGAMKLIHGWAVAKVWPDEQEQKMRYEVMSEEQIKETDFMRDKSKKVVGWRVQRYKQNLPLRRNYWGQCIEDGGFDSDISFEMVAREEVIYSTRGDMEKSFGFGHSVLEKVFDSITKLREKSHADHFRSRVFPMAIVPPNWDDTKVSEYFNALSQMDQSQALITRSGVDAAGNPVPELPSMNWMSPTAPAAQGHSVSGAEMSDINSDWARICSATHHTIGYFVGGGVISASMAAAGSDDNNDLQADIAEFNLLYKDLINDFLKFVNENFWDGSVALPPTICIKSHWEWTRDEIIYNQALMEQEQMEMQQQKAVSNELNHLLRQNIPPNTMMQVQSASGNVKKVYRKEDPTGRVAPKTYVKFKDPYGWYEYSGRDFDHDQVSTDIMQQGGEAVWQHLRKKPSVADNPMSPDIEKKFGSRDMAPYVGSKHKVRYTDGTEQMAELEDENIVGGSGPTTDMFLAGMFDSTTEYEPYGDQFMADPQQEQEVAGFSPEESTEILQRMEEVNRPRVGRPRKTTQIKGGDTRYALPGQRGRASFEQYWDAQGSVYHSDQGMAIPSQSDETSGYGESVGLPPPQATQQPTQRPQGRQTQQRQPQQRGARPLRTIARGLRTIARVGRMLNSAPKEEEMLHEILREHKSINQARKNMHHSPNKIYELMDQLLENEIRVNLSAVGNSFSMHNPFRYIQNGKLSVEFQDPEAVKRLVGQSAPIIITHKYTNEELIPDAEAVIGEYTIKGFDEASGKEIAEYNFDKEIAKEFALKHNETWILPYLEKDECPETSTAYQCAVQYDRRTNKYWQKDFKLRHLAFVEKGNCNKEFCSVALQIEQGDRT